jgi:hypothetical protein
LIVGVFNKHDARNFKWWSQKRILRNSQFITDFFIPAHKPSSFFEEDRISLCHVHPALKALKRDFKDQADTAKGKSSELLEGWRSLR